MNVKVSSRKLKLFDLYSEFLCNKENVFFLDYRGLTSTQLAELRNNIEKEQGFLKVVKNSIVKRVLKEKDKNEVDFCLIGPTAVVIAEGEANRVAKIFCEFGKISTLKVKGGFVLGEFYDEAKINAYSKLPIKTEVIALFVSVLKSSISKLVRTLKALSDIKS